MTKKTHASKKKKRTSANISPVDKQLDLIEHQIVQGNYAEAVTTCEHLLNYLHSMHRSALMCWHNWEPPRACFRTSRKAMTRFPGACSRTEERKLWYNRSMANRFTTRFGQALRDIERAIELNTRSELTEQFDEALQFSRQLAGTVHQIARTWLYDG